MESINKLVDRKLSVQDNINKLTAEKLEIDNKLKDHYLKYHKKLVNLGFYDFQIKQDYTYKPLKGLFRINDSSLPYSYCGEGDYRCIHFKAEKGFLLLSYKQTWNDSSSQRITKIPLNYFDDDDKLSAHIKELLIENTNNVERYFEKEKNKKREKLLNELKNL